MSVLSDVAISIENVSMMFNLNKDKVTGLKDYVVRMLSGKLNFAEFWALHDISFNVKKGEVFGVMGLNGAGKSTLLKVIAGVYKPTKGRVVIDGVIAPLIELGAGFDSEFTAKENVFMNGAMFGRSPGEMEERYDSIMDFAELFEFENVPIKNFSSGMIARLGFAIATNVEPEILIADEILGVGDYKFQMKCQKLMSEMIERGTTILLVSHSLESVKKLCSRAVLLDKGRVAALGSTAEVCKVYEG
jgi:ABC-type polysaccharide/polyol phosphate transport system ATPase subunit